MNKLLETVVESINFDDIVDVVEDVVEVVEDVVEVVDFKKYKLKDLKKMAKKMGLRGFSKLKKGELVKKLQELTSDDTPLIPEMKVEPVVETEEPQEDSEPTAELCEQDYEDFLVANLQHYLDKYMEYKFAKMCKEHFGEIKKDLE